MALIDVKGLWGLLNSFESVGKFKYVKNKAKGLA